MPKTVALIPAFNEAGSIRSVISDLKQHRPSMKILVINDASTDATADEFYHAGETVLTLSFNLGIGGAVQSVLRYAHNYCNNVAVQFDGDGQHLVRIWLRKSKNSPQPSSSIYIIKWCHYYS